MGGQGAEKVFTQGHGVPPTLPAPWYLPPSPAWPHWRPHTGAGVEVCTVRDAAWPGAALAVPSSRDAVDPLGTLQQGTQPPATQAGCWCHQAEQPCCRGAGGSRAQGCSHRGPRFYRGAGHGDRGSRDELQVPSTPRSHSPDGASRFRLPWLPRNDE